MQKSLELLREERKSMLIMRYRAAYGDFGFGFDVLLPMFRGLTTVSHIDLVTLRLRFENANCG